MSPSAAALSYSPGYSKRRFLMNPVTIHLPDDLYQWAEEQAAERGENIEMLMQQALREYLEELEDEQDAQAIRETKEALARGEDQLLDWEEVKANLGISD
jgi:predicted transcriptional regulator